MPAVSNNSVNSWNRETCLFWLSYYSEAPAGIKSVIDYRDQIYSLILSNQVNYVVKQYKCYITDKEQAKGDSEYVRTTRIRTK